MRPDSRILTSALALGLLSLHALGLAAFCCCMSFLGLARHQETAALEKTPAPARHPCCTAKTAADREDTGPTPETARSCDCETSTIDLAPPADVDPAFTVSMAPASLIAAGLAVSPRSGEREGSMLDYARRRNAAPGADMRALSRVLRL